MWGSNTVSFFFFFNPYHFWANSAEDTLVICFLFFTENMIRHFMQTVFFGDNLHEMSKPVFWET